MLSLYVYVLTPCNHEDTKEDGIVLNRCSDLLSQSDFPFLDGCRQYDVGKKAMYVFDN